MSTFYKIFCISFFVFFSEGISIAQIKQQNIARVDLMPNLPKPLKIINYKELAHQFDSTVYDFEAKDKFWPLVWIDSSQINFPQHTLGLFTAIGDVRQGSKNNGMFHEALATMGATLGATLVGIDKAKGGKHNYVAMLKNYFNKKTGWNIMMNNTSPEVALLGGGYGRDWWYDIYPNLLFYAIYDKYPNETDFDFIAKSIADKFCEADQILNGNYDYSFFDYGQMKPMKNAICTQADAAAGHAWVLYCAYKKWNEPKYLKASLSALTALNNQKTNPTYELLMPFGAYLAARINAELDQKFDTKKMLDWSFDGTAICREGWGVLVGNWNGFDISGIVGSTVDRGGYGFLMNTYDAAWPLVPLVRYDPSYATAIGKWMLNASNASRLFYSHYMPDEHETIPELVEVAKEVIAYEGIIFNSNQKEYQNLKAPVAQGDGPLWVPGENPKVSQFSVYGSGHVGIFGSIIKNTSSPGILQLDLLATDFFRDKAYPSYLYYNPYPHKKMIFIELEKGKKVHLYNSVTGQFIAKNVSKKHKLYIQPNQAAVIVHVPAKSTITYSRNKMMANGVVIDFHSKAKS